MSGLSGLPPERGDRNNQEHALPLDRINLVKVRPRFHSLWLVIALSFAWLLLSGCAGTPQLLISPGPAPTDPISPAVLAPGAPVLLHVPADYPTIQAAVDAAVPGQVILIAPGVYHEAVRVKTPGITLRGVDRNRVILNGNFLLPNAVEIESNNVVVENMTAEHYVGNGFYWDGGDGPLLSGYRGSYLTAYDNGEYGLYAFNAQNGQFDHSYAAGHADSGFYIGQCFPCNTVVDQVVSEWNGLGYSGANSGGNLVIRDSLWRENLSGIFLVGQDSEERPPERQSILYHNQVFENHNAQAPARLILYQTIGTGIVLAGSVGNVVLDNRVDDEQYGIILIANPDKHLWVPSDNRILSNTITHSTTGLALAAPTGANNCFSGNTFTFSLPALIEQKYPCDSPLAHLQGGDLSILPTLLARRGALGDRPPLTLFVSHLPALVDQPQLPDVSGPARPIFTDLSLFHLPQAAHAPDVTRADLRPALSSSASLFQFLLGLYAELLPLALYAAWLALGFWDLARNEALSTPARFGWMAALVAVPIVGPVAYYLFGRSPLTRSFRLMFVLGAPGLYLAVTGLLVWMASW
jgi:hypothetical protein